MTYIPTGLDLPRRGGVKAAPATTATDVHPCAQFPSTVHNWVKKTGIEMCELGFTFKDGRWQRKTKPSEEGSRRVTGVTEGESARSGCLAMYREGERFDWCMKLVDEGKSWQQAVCTPIGGAKGVAGVTALAKCVADLKGKDPTKIGFANMDTTGGTSREHRLDELLAECAAAGVPAAFIQQCAAARQQGYSIEEAAGYALEQARIAAGKRRTMLMVGGGAALVVGLIFLKKKKGKK